MKTLHDSEKDELTRQEKFLLFYKPLKERLECFCVSLTRNRESAKDIVSETLLIAYRQFDSLKNEVSFLSYLFTIATRVYQKKTREYKKREIINKQCADLLYGDNIFRESACDIELLYQAMEKLPAVQREAIILFEISGFSNDEICKIQDSSLSAVKMRLKRGRARLAKLLGANNNE